MEPNERNHHLHHQQQQYLTAPYYNPFHHNLTAAPATTSAGNPIPSSNNGNLPPPNDGSSSLAVYPHSVPSSAVNVPIDPVKKKRGRPRKYDTPEQALTAKKLASSASKSLLGSFGALRETGESFTPHVVNIPPGEDVAHQIILLSRQIKHELCILSASGSICKAALSHMASGASVSYEGQYEILSLNGSYTRDENGGKSGGLSVCLSTSDGQIFGGRVRGLLKAAGPVLVVLGTFQQEQNKDGSNGVKGDDALGSGSTIPSPSGTESLPGFHPGMESLGRNPNDQHHTITNSALVGGVKGDGASGSGSMIPSPSATESLPGSHPVMESSGRNPNDQHHTTTSSVLGGGAHFMMQPPQGMHMTLPQRSEWGGTGYDLSGLSGNGSSENEDYE